MRIALKRLNKILNSFGFNPVKLVSSMRGLPVFVADYFALKKQIRDDNFPLGFYPITDDRYKQGGTARGHYFHQDLLVAQKIYQANPGAHIDIGSRVDGFIAHIATFRKVEIVDIRKLDSNIENIQYIQADMMGLPENMYECCDSISCLHALEHFGLGRYGDPVDYDGHLKGFDNIHRMLKENGVLYFSVPIGPQRIEFNAHRVFCIEYLLGMIGEKFEIVSFSFVDDAGDLRKDVELTTAMMKSNCGCNYGCGIFELVKRAND